MSDDKSRSVSRGRDAFQSSGRGGFGNIRPSSVSRDGDRARVDGPDDFSQTRGREPAARAVSPNQAFSTGRGGAGNIRSPSRDALPSGAAGATEQDIIRNHAEAEKSAHHSSGRGGYGNISRSHSRGRTAAAPPPVVHSTGRGGAGNIRPGDGVGFEAVEEEERQQHAHAEGLHSTGRGGQANLTPAHTPGIEHHIHQGGEYESTGRGGAGNFVHDRSRSRDPEKKQHGFSDFLHKVIHPNKDHSPPSAQESGTNVETK